MEEPCTYEEARNAVCKLTSVYFQRKSGNFLKNVSLEEIADMVRINFYGQMPSVNHKQFHRACEAFHHKAFRPGCI